MVTQPGYLKQRRCIGPLLEREKFAWPLRSNETMVTLTGEQLHWLLEGYDVWRMKPHKALDFSYAS